MSEKKKGKKKPYTTLVIRLEIFPQKREDPEYLALHEESLEHSGYAALQWLKRSDLGVFKAGEGRISFE